MSKTGEISLKDMMSYELSPFPTALFEAKYILGRADKPQLANTITNFLKKKSNKTVYLILFHQLNIISWMEDPLFIACHGKGVTVMVPLHSHMQISPYVIMAKQL